MPAVDAEQAPGVVMKTVSEKDIVKTRVRKRGRLMFKEELDECRKQVSVESEEVFDENMVDGSERGSKMGR